MTWRTVVVESRSKLDLKLGFLVIRSESGTKRIHISEISTLVIENIAVSMTGNLLYELSKNKIKVIICDHKRNPFAEFVNYYGSHDTSRKIEKQIAWNKYTKQIVWQEVVAEKIRKQAELLKRLGNEKESAMLDSYILEIKIADETNREGHAAKVYFNSVFGKEFTRTDDSPINAGLNYGYSLLLAAFNREIVANGYLTQLGIFHNNMFNQFNLSSDLMEPFRVLVDKIVVENKFHVFESEQKHILLDMLNQKVRIDKKTHYVNNAIKIYCRSFFEAMEENDLSLIKFYNHEL